ncbi:MAG: AsmA-like C-terminal region-containing protein, partial [Bacteroidia bacterium]
DVKMQGKMSSITKKQYQDFKAEGTFEVDKMNYKTASLPYSVLINQMKLNFTPQVVELTTFDSKLGNSDIQMQGKIENFMQYIFQDSLIKGNFKLTSNLMDLNQLMSSSTTATIATTSTATPAASTVTAVPTNIDFVLNTDIKKMLYDKMEITNVVGNVIVRNARASMQDVKMNMLDGALLMNGYYDTKDMRKPAINFNLNANDFDIQKTVATFNTIKTLAPIANAAHGKFSASLNNFTGILKPDMSPDLTTLTGNGVFQTKSIGIQDYAPFVKLDDALRLNKLKSLTLNDVNLSYEFKDGRVTTKPFKINVASIPCEISGSTGFDQTIDYKWTMEVPTKLMGAQAQQMAQGLLTKAGSLVGANVSLPEKVNITAFIGGTVTKPTIKTGLKGDKNGGGAVQQVKDAVVGEVKQVASQQAEKLLAAAQQQADALKAEGAKLSQQARDAGYRAADSLVSSVSNPLAKIAAKKVAERMKKEADAKAQKLNDEAGAKADKIMVDAHAQADKLK